MRACSNLLFCPIYDSAGSGQPSANFSCKEKLGVQKEAFNRAFGAELLST
tara:strand:- start:1 stop:150 length:150 start_codon:yes stop_codon:yes gene_type:complete